MSNVSTLPPSNTRSSAITPSPRKKLKKFVDTSKKLSNTNSMYGVICKRGFVLLFCEAGNTVIARNYQNPGSCKKAWATLFEKGKYFLVNKTIFF